MLFRTVDDIVLKGAGQGGKQGAVAGHPHNQALIFLRMLLSVQQRLPADYVKLNMAALLVKIGAHQSDKICKAAVSRQGRKDGNFILNRVPLEAI